MNIRETQLEAHENAVNKGFWEVETRELEPLAWMMQSFVENANLVERWRKTGHSRYYLEILDVVDAYRSPNLPEDDDEIALWARLCLIVTEVAEAAEAEDKDHLAEELADIVIRVMDLAGGYNIDLQSAIRTKMELNEKRPRLHGKRC